MHSAGNMHSSKLLLYLLKFEFVDIKLTLYRRS